MRSKSIFLIGAMVLLGLLLSAFVSGQTAQGDSTSTRTLGVTGTGQVYLTPDTATISIGVRNDHESASEAVADNNVQIQKVVTALKDIGVAEKDIQTSNFSIYPQQQYDDQGNVTSTTYVVENTVMVKIRDLDKLGDVLDAAVSNGANSIYGIQFDVEDKTAALTEARQKAVDDAKVKAGELADAAGVTLGPIQTVTESTVYPGPIFDARGGGAEQAVASAVPISPGQLTITSNVDIVFAIE
jgi:uncharacterized protein YggE